jgi:hypothetical protein
MYMLVAETWMEMMYALQNTTSSRWNINPTYRRWKVYGWRLKIQFNQIIDIKDEPKVKDAGLYLPMLIIGGIQPMCDWTLSTSWNNVATS